MLRIDGSKHSGSGTVLRYVAALATLTRQAVNIVNIRARRDKPGLRPQHLTALRACCTLCSGRLEGDRVGSQEIRYWPGKCVKGGDFSWDIGTAGSATMLAFTLIAPALHAKTVCRFNITGGLFQDFAPSAFHMQHVLLPLLRRMGAHVRLAMGRPGYVPKGEGCLQMTVIPRRSALQALTLLEQGNLLQIRGIALASHLQKERVSERMAEHCREILTKAGYQGQVEVRHDHSAIQRGAALCLWAETDQGCILGSDQAGKRGRRSEAIAEVVCSNLLQDLHSGATTDRHLADQLILFAALAKGTTRYVIPMTTEHVKSNLWLVGKILGARSQLADNRLSLEGTGLGLFESSS